MTEVIDGNENPYNMFLLGMKSKATRRKYIANLKLFFSKSKELATLKTMEEQCLELVKKTRENPSWLSHQLMGFAMWALDQIEDGKIVSGTARNYFKALALFFEQNDVTVNIKRYTRGFPPGRRYSNDTIPTMEMLRKLCKYPDRRMRFVIYSMVSGGFRLGAWDYLRWGHVRPLYSDDGERVIAAKVIIYAGELGDEYYTFITPEAYYAMLAWMNFRADAGEIINRDSWVLRDKWDTYHARKIKGAKIDAPKRLKSTGLKTHIGRAWYSQGLRTGLEDGKKRHDYQQVHTFRKVFKTMCEAARMKSINIEMLMGHSIGVSDSYYRPREEELLEDYLRAVPYLTIEDTVSVEQAAEIEKKSEMNSSAIETLSEEVIRLRKQLEDMQKERDGDEDKERESGRKS